MSMRRWWLRGLTMPGGTFDTTGVAGLTLGGGLGHLMGVQGLTLDHLVSAEVVLANGDVVVVSSTDEPDLFWALRGGGGNFGVVTVIRVRARAAAAGFSAAFITYAPPRVRERDSELFRDLMDAAPDEMTMMAYLSRRSAARDGLRRRRPAAVVRFGGAGYAPQYRWLKTAWA